MTRLFLGNYVDVDTNETVSCYRFYDNEEKVAVQYDYGWTTSIPMKLFKRLTDKGTWIKETRSKKGV